MPAAQRRLIACLPTLTQRSFPHFSAPRPALSNSSGPRSQEFDDTVVSDREPIAYDFHGRHTGRVLSGRYLLKKPLGTGGMGEVYEAEHLALGTQLAIKIMHPHIAAQPDYVRRFSREARAASLLRHKNVVQVLDFGEDQGIFFLVMEFLTGLSLGRFLAQLSGLPPLSDVAAILTEILVALECAHAHGIVHRDLKPDNIFLAMPSELNGHFIVKLLDFGLAHVEDPKDQGPTLTHTDSIGGTPDYMSPEQCRSLSVGPSADLYSAGCILTVLLQGRPPFAGESAMDVISQHMFLAAPPLSRPPDAEPVPPLLERLRLDLLAKSPTNRPADAAAARARLAEAMSPALTAARFPERKGNEPLGEREKRVEAFGFPERPSPKEHALPGNIQQTYRIDFEALSERPGGTDGMVRLGLAAQGILTAGDAENTTDERRHIMLLDVGADISAASRIIRERISQNKNLRIIVCAEKTDIEKINVLIASGAADVVSYPVTADVLGKKISRQLARRKR